MTRPQRGTAEDVRSLAAARNGGSSPTGRPNPRPAWNEYTYGGTPTPQERSRHDHRPTHLRRLERLRVGPRPGHRRDRLVERPDEVRLRLAAARRRPPDRFDERLPVLPGPADRRHPLAQPAEGLRGGV